MSHKGVKQAYVVGAVSHSLEFEKLTNVTIAMNHTGDKPADM